MAAKAKPAAATMMRVIAVILSTEREVLSDGTGVERRQGISEPPLLRPRLLSAGHLKDQAKQIPSDLFDRSLACRDRSCIQIDQVRPLFGQRRSGGHLEDWNQSQTVRTSFASRKNMQVHGSKLLSAADEI